MRGKAVSEATALDASVLVLNRLYMAVNVVSARRAFTLLAKSQAEVVAVEDNQFNSYDFETWIEAGQARDRWKSDGVEWVRAVSFDIMVPKIIRLLFYDRLPQTRVKFNRRNIFARDENRCQYCGKKRATNELSLDHVIPRSRGGQTTWENVVCSCTRCNARKGGRLPEEAGLSLYRKPAKPRRSPVIRLKLLSDKYQTWKQFLDNAYWNVELK
jgi:5-methylcytosine-specific restriction endonuclease McrA